MWSNTLRKTWARTVRRFNCSSSYKCRKKRKHKLKFIRWKRNNEKIFVREESSAIVFILNYQSVVVKRSKHGLSKQFQLFADWKMFRFDFSLICEIANNCSNLPTQRNFDEIRCLIERKLTLLISKIWKNLQTKYAKLKWKQKLNWTLKLPRICFYTKVR